MQVIKVKNYEELSKVAADIIADLIKAKPDCTLGLATGSSPIGLYQNLIKMYEKGEISFKDVKTYNLDEYCQLPKSHPESYYSFMHRNLFYHVDIKEENVHIPNSEGNDLNKLCNDYNELLHKASIDLQLLGIGANGHIGFNEPGTSFDQETFVVKLTDKTRQDNKRFFASIDEVPKYAMTMGIKNIMQAKKVLLVASGANKRDAIKKLLSGEVTESCPATILNRHKDAIIIVDEAALGLGEWLK